LSSKWSERGVENLEFRNEFALFFLSGGLLTLLVSLFCKILFPFTAKERRTHWLHSIQCWEVNCVRGLSLFKEAGFIKLPSLLASFGGVESLLGILAGLGDCSILLLSL
jgi:hypothetical protein